MTEPSTHARDAVGVLRSLDRSAQGLTGAEAAARLERHGPRRLAQQAPPTLWGILLRQFKGALIYGLPAAALAHALSRVRGLAAGVLRRPAREGDTAHGRHTPDAARQDVGRAVGDHGSRYTGADRESLVTLQLRAALVAWQRRYNEPRPPRPEFRSRSVSGSAGNTTCP